MLALLRPRGPAGVTNIEFVGMMVLNYGARLEELRDLGYEIETIQESKSLFRYVLHSEPEKPKPSEQPETPKTFTERHREEEERRFPLFASAMVR